MIGIGGCASDEVREARDPQPANTNLRPVPNPTVSPAQLEIARDLITKSGFVHGEFEIAMTTPAIDQDGTLAGVVALVRLREPLSGEIVLPSMRAAADDSGQTVLIGSDTTYSVRNLSALSFGVDFAASSIRSVTPGDRSSPFLDPEYGEATFIGNGPEFRLDGTEGPIPSREEGR